MAFQGEYLVDRYGAQAARATPPVRQLLASGAPLGAVVHVMLALLWLAPDVRALRPG